MWGELHRERTREGSLYLPGENVSSRHSSHDVAAHELMIQGYRDRIATVHSDALFNFMQHAMCFMFMLIQLCFFRQLEKLPY